MIKPDMKEGTSTSVRAAAEKEPKRLFVYGSLMEGFFNYDKSLRGKVISSSPGKIRGLLYHQSLKGYPALVEGEGWVRGEFLELADFAEIISICDRIEVYLGPGNPGNEYERRVSVISLDNGVETPAQVYWYARSDLDSPKNPVVRAASGDWREFMTNADQPSPALRRVYTS